jgi:glyoxylate/hydroxypyruvate reductase A
MSAPTLLMALPRTAVDVFAAPFAAGAPDLNVVIHGRDTYAPESVDYVFSFRPPAGLLKSLPNLKIVFSVGAGVDGFLADADYPQHVPLVRLVDHTLARDMTHYIVLQTLMHHRRQRMFDDLQHDKKWRQSFPPRRTEDTRIGILGMGAIGSMAAERLRDLDFAVAGWSRDRKTLKGIESFAGDDERDAFLARTDILVCVLPLTPQTRGILNRKTLSLLPRNAFVVNVARGEHLIEADLIAAIDDGHIAGAALAVFETEPLPESSPLWSHPRVSITPHVAALSEARASANNVVDSIARHRRGEPLVNVVDFSRGY